MTTTVPVGGPSAYDVVIGERLEDQVAALLAGVAVVVIADEAVARLAEPVVRALRETATRVELVTVSGGERAKSLPTVERLWDELGRLRVTRCDAIVAVGGGATTDVVGFVAATWLRGVRVVHVPTTLLAMVDASVGGKTGINTDAGKNLVGAFHAPAGVFVDTAHLDTLPRREWVNGMAEVVKAGFIADPEILRLIEADLTAAADPLGTSRGELVERSIRVKAQVVSEDFRETGAREALNYGHTLGHAVERVERYRLPHGHAVSIGLAFAAELGRRCGRLDEPTAVRHGELLSRIGLPTAYRAAAWPELLTAMRHDKKARGDRLRFVVLDGIAQPGILDGPSDELLQATYAEVSR